MIGATDAVRDGVFAFLAAELDAGRDACLLTVIESSGSVPQRQGACAVVGEGGLLWGTIGGGRLEGDAIEAARRALGSEQAFVLDIDLADGYSRDAGPICGGLMKVFGNPLTTESLANIRHLAAKSSGGVHITTGGEEIGRLDWQAEPVARGGCFLLAITRVPQLVVVGAGHCGRAIAELGCWLGFETSVIDDRQDLLDPQVFPAEVALIEAPIAQFAQLVSIGPDSYIALVSMGHQSDAEALEACIHSEAAYIGMIGSRRKIQLLKRHFLSEGLASAEQWDRIHAPIGLDIGAKSVREIATSVLAQIIAERRRRAGQ